MPRTPYKLSRKQLKHPDEFVTGLERIRDFSLRHRFKVLVGAGAVVLGAAVFIGLRLHQQTRIRLASDRFYEALNALNSGHYKQAEEQFAGLAADQPGLKLGRLAHLYLATTRLEQGRPAQARDALTTFVKEVRDPPYLSLGLTELGVIYEQMGDLKKAESAYRRSAGVPGPGQLRAQLAIARILAKRGERQAAIDAYRHFLEAHPFAPERRTVIDSLALLGASSILPAPPEGITAPVPSPPAAAGPQNPAR